VDPKEAEIWKSVTLRLRQRDQRDAQYSRALITAPRSPAAMVIRAHRFASQGNYEQALDIADELAARVPNDPLVKKLVAAIRNKTELPSLAELPINVPAGSSPNSENTGNQSETVVQPSGAPSK
jgi:Flp pilus assembly protein TadD